MKRIKQLIHKGVHKLAPGLSERLRQLHRIEASMKQLEAEVSSMRQMLSAETRDTRLDQLRQLIQKVEPYQPTYGISGIIPKPQRESRDRCIAIENAIRPLPGKRILDLGSSLGYVPMYMADRGAVAEGWEIYPVNVEISKLISEINGIHADFKTREVDLENVKKIPHGHFDVVVVLSLFHHIVHFKGLRTTQKIVKELLDRAPVMIVELARKGEDPSLFWDKAQPDDELAIFDLVRDNVTIKEIGSFKNHLSDNQRPLYLVERVKTIKVNAKVYEYEHRSQEAYPDSEVARSQVRRRYYFGKGHIAKEYFFDKTSFRDNVAQILNETQLFLNVVTPTRVYHAPEMLDFEVTRERAVVVVRKVEGELASELNRRERPVDVRRVARDVLTTLADLEKYHLYHNDVRSWNIIIDKTGAAWLIDYGRAGVIRRDNDAIALVWMLHALVTGEREATREDKTSLPRPAVFKNKEIRQICEAVAGGEYSPAKLLTLLNARES